MYMSVLVLFVDLLLGTRSASCLAKTVLDYPRIVDPLFNVLPPLLPNSPPPSPLCHSDDIEVDLVRGESMDDRCTFEG